MSTSSKRLKKQPSGAAKRRTTVDLPAAFRSLFQPSRYKVYYGGRGGAKSWTMARALVLMAADREIRVLCAREFQSSIADSVHRLLSDQIWDLGLADEFTITASIITSKAGSEFIFKGLRKSIQEIKSTEGIDICWVEEAQSVSKESWNILIPTIRKQGSEIWVSFNPFEETDPTYTDFVLNPKPDSVVQKVNFDDNPWFPDTLDAERRYLLSIDQEAYDHVWGGNPRAITDAVIFGKRTVMDRFEAPEGARFFYGADWGFSTDPTAMVRCYIDGDSLFIDYEAFGWGTEIDETPALFDQVPGSRDWPIKADAARPETISYMRRQGFAITAADKWDGSVEDGIAHLKGFARIVIHERCKHMNDERRLYRYKVDAKTNEILPQIVDKHNHGWDAIRYSLDGYIQRRGSPSLWAKLAGR